MNNKHVHWLTPGHFPSFNHLLHSNLASIRMRAGAFGKKAGKIGVTFTFGNYVDHKATHIVIAKIGGDCGGGRSDDWLRWIKEAKLLGKEIILDYTDHHLLDPTTAMGRFYHSIMPFIDKAVVPSNKMKNLLSVFFTGSIQIIEDPLEIEIFPPQNPFLSLRPTVLWFGHSTNITYLMSYLESEDLCDGDFNLRVLSNEAGLTLFSSRLIKTNSLIKVNLEKWSIQKMIDVASFCDACIIPSDINDSKKSGVSANRLTTSLALGLPTMAENLSSYSEFNSFYTDIRSEPISRFFLRKAQELTKVAKAQAEILPYYTQENIADKWIKFFDICHH